MIDKSGFSRPEYNEIVQDLTDKWKENFGQNVNTSTHSVSGVFIKVIAYFLNKMYMLSEQVYDSQFIETASGQTLDMLAENLGQIRNPKMPAIGEIAIYGNANYKVPAGTIFRTEDGLQYATSEDIILDKKEVHFSDNSVLSSNDNEKMYGYSANLYAFESGYKYNKPLKYANYKVNQLTPVSEIQNVYIGLVNGGTDEETDIDFRERLLFNLRQRPSSPKDGVISAIKNVTGVKTVNIVENSGDETDKYGTLWKSIQIYVNGGKDEDVAQAIYDNVSVGIPLSGKVSTQITGLDGKPKVIKFSRPEVKPVFVKISLQTNSSYSSSETNIKKIISDYINSVSMGGNVYYSYIYKLIYDEIEGIDVANVEIGENNNELASKDIKLGMFETCSISNIEVEVS